MRQRAVQAERELSVPTNWKTTSIGVTIIAKAIIHLFFIAVLTEADLYAALDYVLIGVGFIFSADIVAAVQPVAKPEIKP